MLRTGTVVEWSWGQRKARSKIAGILTKDITRTFKGAQVSRKARDDQPACLIEQDDGARLLKSRSDVTRAD